MIPKPKHCEQNWLDMKPANGGRMCGQCQKKIIDFSKMKWAKIEKLQAEFNNELCGMYNPKQLDNWGREVPKTSLNKLLVVTAAVSTFGTSLKLDAQNDSLLKVKNKIFVSGTIKGKLKNGNTELLPYATVFLKDTKYATTTNDSGYYKLDITEFGSAIADQYLTFMSIDYDRLDIKLNTELQENNECNVILTQKEKELAVFYVEAPTLKNRIKWKLRKWFNKDK